MTTTGLVLGVDGGQTSTKSMLVTADGQILATGAGGPSDHFHSEGGIEKNRIALHGAILDALDQAAIPPERIETIALGLTGAPSNGSQDPVIRDIVRETLPHLPDSRIVIEPDYKTNLAGASGGRPGVVLIAGGGCIAYGVSSDGREALAGGYGYLLGDQGSAFDIGLRAIDAATKADDWRGPPTSLEGSVREHFALARIRDITRVVYRAGFSREQISLLTPRVTAAARAGDEVARTLLVAAAAEAAGTAVGVFRQLYGRGDQATVYLTGGVFQSGDVYLDPFRTALAQGWPGSEAIWPRFPPVVGGVIVAARSAGIDVGESWLRRLEERRAVAPGDLP